MTPNCSIFFCGKTSRAGKNYHRLSNPHRMCRTTEPFLERDPSTMCVQVETFSQGRTLPIPTTPEEQMGQFQSSRSDDITLARACARHL